MRGLVVLSCPALCETQTNFTSSVSQKFTSEPHPLFKLAGLEGAREPSLSVPLLPAPDGQGTPIDCATGHLVRIEGEHRHLGLSPSGDEEGAQQRCCLLAHTRKPIKHVSHKDNSCSCCGGWFRCQVRDCAHIIIVATHITLSIHTWSPQTTPALQRWPRQHVCCL